MRSTRTQSQICTAAPILCFVQYQVYIIYIIYIFYIHIIYIYDKENTITTSGVDGFDAMGE